MSQLDDELYHESHYCAMEKQGNVYSMRPITCFGKADKVLYSSNISDKLMVLKFDFSELKMSPLSVTLVTVYPLSNGNPNFIGHFSETLVDVAALDVIENKNGFTVGVVFKPHDETMSTDAVLKLSNANVSNSVGSGGGGNNISSGIGSVSASTTNTGMTSTNNVNQNYRLHIYSCSEDGSYLEGPNEKPVESTGAFHLTHSFYWKKHSDDCSTNHGQMEPVFLLATNDMLVHVYDLEPKETTLDNVRNDAKLFPELQKPQHGKIHWIDTTIFESRGLRLTAFCTDSGLVRLALVNVWECSLLQLHEFEQDAPLTRCLLFDHWPRTSATCHDTFQAWSKKVDHYVGKDRAGWNDPAGPHLVVCSGLEPPVCYLHPLHGGLTLDNQIMLPFSEHRDKLLIGSADGPNNSVDATADSFDNIMDCALSACATDVDLDGLPELVLGTFGQSLLCYKFLAPNWDRIRMAHALHEFDDSDEAAAITMSRTAAQSASFNLLYSRRFADPVLQIAAADLTGDGADELVVLTGGGVHILQRHRVHSLACLEARLRHLVKKI